LGLRSNIAKKPWLLNFQHRFLVEVLEKKQWLFEALGEIGVMIILLSSCLEIPAKYLAIPDCSLPSHTAGSNDLRTTLFSKVFELGYGLLGTNYS